MSRRGVSAPLAVQMEDLKKSMHSRDKRRNQDKLLRAVQADGMDVYEKRPLPGSGTGGINLGPASAAQAAVQRAAALEGPRMLRCDLCQANFPGEALYKQHLEGPIHRKALAKEEARRQRELQLGANYGAAESAMAAAAWANGGVLSGRLKQVTAVRPGEGTARPAAETGSMLPGHQQPPPSSSGAYQHAGSTGVLGRLGAAAPGAPPNRKQKSLPGRGALGKEAAAEAEAARRASNFSHAELVAQSRREMGPISIGGWVPPSIRPVEPRPEQAPSEEDVSGAQQEPLEPQAAAPEHAGESEQPQQGSDEQNEDEPAQEPGLGSLVAYSGEDSEDEHDDSDLDDPARPKIVSFF